jgi:hypothetical protein
MEEEALSYSYPTSVLCNLVTCDLWSHIYVESGTLHTPWFLFVQVRRRY